jgi:hypothetical protein
MRKTRNALLGILTMMSGAILAVPTEAAEQYIPGVHLELSPNLGDGRDQAAAA